MTKTTYSESGQPIYHYDKTEEGWKPPVFDDEDICNKIESPIEKYIGKIDKVFHELVSDIIHLDVYHITWKK